ncbi:MAG TPA: amidohydrolase [Pyrinomonadaceae bacterium]|nr:amidohydrolase [Pyrinomonadaceae bacterium]
MRLAADLIIINANVRTMDPNQPRASAIAVLSNRIVAVGANEDIKQLAGPATKMIDVAGQLVLPGFNDAHVHFMSGGFQLSSVDLRDADTPEEFAERIRDFAAKLPEGKWMTGGDWDHERWPEARLPTKELIDGFTPDTPVFVNRLDCHMALVNSVVLKLAGVTRDTRDPDGGVIVRDANGEPTGILKDAALGLVWKVFPPRSFDERVDAARAATNYAASLGVTSVQDMSAGADASVYQTLLDHGELKTRIYAVWPLPRWNELAQTGVRAAFGGPMLRTGGLKGFADGSLGSTTALFFDPYLDEPKTCGIPSDEMFPAGAMLERARGADQAGLQVLIHAIGDRANDEVLSIYETIESERGARDRRFRIEHAQHLRSQDIPRFKRHHIIASMQPSHAIDDGRWAEKRIGSERAKMTYAFRSLLDSQTTLAFGTDWTVAPLDPLLTIYAAMTRRTPDGKYPDGWIPEQKISIDEAVHAYTVGSAYAEFQDHEKGTITPGKLADIVVLSEDIFKIDPLEIKNTRVMMTIMDGQVVYEARE